MGSNNTLGRRLKTYRHQAGLSQYQLASKAGISSDYVSRIERHKVINVGIRKLESLAEALQIDVRELLASD